MQERLESSVGGRVVISILVVVLFAAVVAWNLPESELGRQGRFRLKPVVNAAGLDQTWAVFAPDPPRQEVELEARIAYADGTERRWRVPTGDPLVGAYRDYRWLKWAEWMTSGATVVLWEPAAAWIAREELDAGRRPLSVTLIRQMYDVTLGTDRASPRPVEFYVYPVPNAAPDMAGVPAP